MRLLRTYHPSVLAPPSPNKSKSNPQIHPQTPNPKNKQVKDLRLHALRARQHAVDASVAQLTRFVLPIRTWMKLGETKGLDMSVRDGAPKSAAVRERVDICCACVCVRVCLNAATDKRTAP